jgi:hypothetical protein
MPGEKERFIYKKYWTNVAGLVKQGKGQTYLRGELNDIPANQLEVPEVVPVYIAKDREAKDEHSKFVAIMEVNGNQAIITMAATREKVREHLYFDMAYSKYAPSLYYRAFRSLLGYSDKTIDEYTTSELRRDNSDKIFKAVAIMAGADINKLNGGNNQ